MTVAERADYEYAVRQQEIGDDRIREVVAATQPSYRKRIVTAVASDSYTCTTAAYVGGPESGGWEYGEQEPIVGDQVMTATEKLAGRRWIVRIMRRRTSVAAVVNVMDHGASTALSATNDIAFQAAIDAAIPLGGSVYVPRGTYRFASKAGLNLRRSDVEMYGDGWDSSILISAEGTDLDPHYFVYDDDTPNSSRIGNRSFRDLQFRGTWSSDMAGRGGYAHFFMSNVGTISFERCKFIDISRQGMQIRGARRVSVTDCHFERIAYDCIFVGNTFNQVVARNFFKNTDDDYIALHQGAFEITYGLDGAPSEGIIVADNIAEDVKGMSLVGIRTASVHNNVIRRGKGSGIAIWRDTDDAGVVPQFSISVKDNKVHDTIDRPPFTSSGFCGIYVIANAPKGGSSTGGIVPGENDPATGVFVRPENHRNANYATSGSSLAPMHDVEIVGNTVTRTLPAVAKYSDWGYGKAFSRDGWHDEAVTDASLRLDRGIQLDGDTRFFRIDDNTVSYAGSAVLLSAPTRHFAADSSVISGNILSRFTTAGIHVISAAYSLQLAIRGNTFNGDPYHEHSNRKTSGGVDGSWKVNLDGPTGILAGSSYGFTVDGNRFANVCNPVYAASPIRETGNEIYCDPVAPGGFSTTNKGIGYIPNAGVEYTHSETQANPSAANYMKVTGFAGGPVGAGSAAPVNATYLTATANGTLTNEVVVGATPGGEFGGTWAAPTVDATHSGSSHAGTQTAAEATAAAALAAHAAAGDPHSAYALDSDVAAAFAALSSVYQPLDSDLTAIAALTTTSFGRSFLDRADAAAGRTLLGLGTAATHATSDYDATGAAAAAQAASQPLDSDLTAIAALTTTSFGRALLALADAAALRTAAGLGSLATLSAIGSAEITDGSVALADMANLATNKLIGRATAGTGVPEAIDLSAAGRALIDDADATAQLVTLGAYPLPWSRGTSFPGSPAAGWRCTRSDRGGIDYEYDGTRWLSVEEYPLPLSILFAFEDTNNAPGLFGVVDEGANGAWVTRLVTTTMQASGSGANYVTYQLISVSSAGVAHNIGSSFNTSADTSGVYTTHTVTIGAAVTAGDKFYKISGTKTGSPTTLELFGAAFYRLVG